MNKGNSRLTKEEGVMILRKKANGKRVKEIREATGLGKNTVYEVMNKYRSVAGLKRSWLEEGRPRKSKADEGMLAYIIDRLKEGWSPQQIVGRMKQARRTITVSYEWVYRDFNFKEAKKKQIVRAKKEEMS